MQNRKVYFFKRRALLLRRSFLHLRIRFSSNANAIFELMPLVKYTHFAAYTVGVQCGLIWTVIGLPRKCYTSTL